MLSWASALQWEPPVGASVGVVGGPAPEGVGVLTGLNAFCANTLFGRLTNKITGAAEAALDELALQNTTSNPIYLFG